MAVFQTTLGCRVSFIQQIRLDYIAHRFSFFCHWIHVIPCGRCRRFYGRHIVDFPGAGLLERRFSLGMGIESFLNNQLLLSPLHEKLRGACDKLNEDAKESGVNTRLTLFFG